MGKKEKLITASHSLFLKNGYSATTIEDIAKESNVAKGTLYNYFKSKEEILTHILNQEVSQLREKFIKLKGLNIPLRKKMKYVLREFLVEAIEHPEVFLLRLKFYYTNDKKIGEELKALRYNLNNLWENSIQDILETSNHEVKDEFLGKLEGVTRNLHLSINMYIYGLLSNDIYTGNIAFVNIDQLKRNVTELNLDQEIEFMLASNVDGILK